MSGNRHCRHYPSVTSADQVDREHCHYYQADKFFLNAVPTLCCLAVLLAVGGYITHVHLHPPGAARPVLLPAPPTLPTSVQTSHNSASSEMEPQVIPTLSAKVAWQQETVRRKDHRPFMFFRVSQPRLAPPAAGQCLPPAAVETLRNIRECLKLNIISLCIIGFMLPEDFVFLFAYVNGTPGIVCANSVARNVVEYVIIPWSFLFMMIHPYLVKKKLDNFKF